MPSHRLEHRLGFGVGEVEIRGLGDLPFGVGDYKPGLLTDGRAVTWIVSGHGVRASSGVP